MTSPPPKHLSGPAAFAVMVIAVLILTVLALAASAAASSALRFADGPLSILISAALIAVTMAAALAISVWQWRRLDEAAREAHKWAWWWGGSSGMGVGLITFMALTLRPDPPAPIVWFGPAPGDQFMTGVISILVCQLVGYAVAWAFWWLRTRR